MIRLIRPEKPTELTEKKIKDFTDTYKNSKTNVWNKEYIKARLLEMSNGKCAYCETKIIGIRGKDQTIDHFHPKGLYEEEVVKWENLLPACIGCNRIKNVYDTKRNPIVDPTKENPKEFFYLENVRLKSKNEIGQRTIELLQLNKITDLATCRIEIVMKIGEKIEEFLEIIKKDATEQAGIIETNRVKKGITEILEKAQKNAEYSAVIATVIYNTADYKELKAIMKSKNIWSKELQELHIGMEAIKLDTTKE